MKTTFTAFGHHFCRACVGAVSLLLSVASVKADSVTPTSIVVGPSAGSQSVVLVKANLNATWTNTANAPWLHVSASGSYSTNHLQSFTFDQNVGGLRSGSMSIDGTTISVTQLGATFVPVTQATTVVTAADTGSQFVQAMAADPAGNIYFSNGNYLKKWTAATNTVSTLVDGNSGQISFTSSIAVNAAGDVYIADSDKQSILKWTAATSAMSTLVAFARSTVAIALDAAGNVYFNDGGTIRRWLASSATDSLLFNASLIPVNLTVDAKGDLYFYDSSGAVKKRRLTKTTPDTISVNVGTLREPYGAAIDAYGNLYFADVGAALNDGLAALRKWDASTAPSSTTTMPITGLNFPHSVAFDSNGTLIVADSGNFTVRALPRAFVSTTAASVPLAGGSGAVPFAPATAPMTGPFAPSASQPWITINSTIGGQVSFTAAATGSARYGYVTVLGQQVLVQQGTPSLATATVSAATNLTPLTATLNGNITADGGAPITERGVLFSDANANPVFNDGLSTRVPASQAGTGAFTVDITGLSPSTTYFFRSYAITSAGVAYSGVPFFTTTTPTPAVLATPTATGYDATKGTIALNGNVTSEGNTPVTSRGFVYAITANNSNPQIGGTDCTSFTDSGTGTGTFSKTINGLLPSTQYSLRSWAVNLSGTAYSTIATFTTPAGTYKLGADTLLADSSASTQSILLGVTPPAATWTAVANDAWIQATTTSGTGTTVLTFTLSANSGTTRTGTLTIAGQTLTITQAPTGYAAVSRATQLGTALSSSTAGVAVDTSGNVFADPSEGLLMRWTPASNSWTQVATTLADYQSYLATDPAGNVLFSTRNTAGYNRRLDKWTATSGPVSAVYPNAGTPGIGGFDANVIATDSQGNVWLAYYDVKRYNPTTNVMTTMFSPPPNTRAVSVALDAADNVYVGLQGFSSAGHSVVKYDAVTGVLSVIIPENYDSVARSLAVDGCGNVYFVQAVYGGADTKVMKWNAATNTVSVTLSGLTPVDINTGNVRVNQIAVDRAGSLYVADTNTIVELPRVFVPTAAVNVGLTASNGTLPVTIPSTAIVSAPFAPTAADSWLHIDSNTAGSVSYSWDTLASGGRYGYLVVAGQRILVQQGTPSLPTLSTPTGMSASGNLYFSASVTADGGGPLTARGVALALTSDNTNPQLGGTGVVVINDSTAAVGSFTATATGLSPNTRYTFSAFATNSTGTSYSTPVTIATPAYDSSVNLSSFGSVYTMVPQLNGRVLIGGSTGIVRLDPSYSADAFYYFNSPSEYATSLLSLADNSFIIAGSFTNIGGVTRTNMARCDSGGALDPFAPNVNGTISCMALQSDGSILIGGEFTQVNGIARNRIARLYSNGTLDLTFNPNANGPVRSIALQPDGKMLVGGEFTLVGTTLCNRLARLSTLGVAETTFVASADAGVNVIALQPDGGILIGGSFNLINNVAHAKLARLNPNGTLDNDYPVVANGTVRTIALQADGQVFIGGSFTTIASKPRIGVARLRADGTLDDWNADVTDYSDAASVVNSLMIAPDGRVFIGGEFNKVGGSSVNYAASLLNAPVVQTLEPAGSSVVEWTRSTSLPEVLEVSFELSTDGGGNYSPLGKGTRIAGGWRLSGLPVLPATGNLRASARTLSGMGSGSGGWISAEAAYTLANQEIVVEQPENTARSTGDSIDLGTLGLNVPLLTTFTVRNSGGFDLTGINVTVSGTNAAMFTIATKPLASLGSLDSTEFIVQAKLTSSGPKTAMINIASNDANENPFVINLTATGITAVLPVVATIAPPTSIGYDTATVTGTVDAKGSLREVFFDYGLTTTYSDTVPASTPTTSTSGTFSAALPDLLPHKLYNYRIRAAGDLGNASGVNKTFTTLNHAPVANADTVVMLPGAVATIDALANDTDDDDDTLTITAKSAVTPSTAGTVAITANQLVFTATTGFTGSATFTYTISDGFNGTATGTVTVNRGGAPTLSPTALNVSSAAGEYDVTITTNGAWAVTETPTIAWASQSQVRGAGTTTFKVSVQANSTLAARIGHIFIGGVDLPITQAAVAAPAIGPLSGTFNTIVGESYSLAIPTTNAPVTYVVTGTLPPGLTLNQATGFISGVPTTPGTYALKVKASNAAGAATATGAVTQPNLEFSIVVAALPAGAVGTFHGYVERSATAKFTTADNLGARFEMTTQSNGTVSGSVIEGVTKKSFTGAKLVSRSGTPSTHTLTAALTGTTLFIDITLDPANNAATGVLRNASGLSTAAITAWRIPWSTVAPVVKATDYKAFHTFRIENQNTSSGPQGFGFGSFSVTESTGALALSGKLPDGSAITGSTFVGAGGQVLVYQSLNSNRASCFGKLTITPGTNKPLDNSIAGTLTWLKPASLTAAKDTVYAVGFPLLTLDLQGGTFNAPPKGGRLLGALDQADNSQLIFGAAGSDTGFTQLLRIVNPNNVTGTTNTASITAKINSTALPTLTFGTGAFGGSFIIAGTPARIAPFVGQIVTIGTATQGYGYYLLPGIPGTGQTVTTSPKLSGRVELQLH